MNIALIPARGGSKRIPRKNIKDFNGKPIISYAIELCVTTGIFEEIYVTTDDDEIATIAMRYGAKIHYRSTDVADDKTPIVPVVQEFIRNSNLREGVKAICCVFPCVPLLKATMIDRAHQLILNGHSFAYPIVRYSHPIQRAISMEGDKPIFREPENELVRTQDLKDYFHDSGQFYFGKLEGWIAGAHMHTAGTAFEISKLDAIDIDNQEDWVLAEDLFNIRRNKRI